MKQNNKKTEKSSKNMCLEGPEIRNGEMSLSLALLNHLDKMGGEGERERKQELHAPAVSV